MKIVAWIAFGLCLALTRSEAEGTRGVIDDPDGYVNVRASNGADAGVVAKVKAGEPFTFEYEPGADWCKVTLKSGQTGW
ncbi:MAG: SH3 domain-containing protein, partial [Chthoniobacterales bacterium]